MTHAINTIYRQRFSLTMAALFLFLALALFSGVSAFCAVRCGDVQFWDGEMHHAVPAAHIFPTNWRTAADISVKMREGRLRAGKDIPSGDAVLGQNAAAVPYASEIRQQLATRQAAASQYFWLFLCFGGISIAILAVQKVAPEVASRLAQLREDRLLRAGGDLDGYAAAQPERQGQVACLSEVPYSQPREAFRPAALLSSGLPPLDRHARFYSSYFVDSTSLGPSNKTPALHPEIR